MTMTSLSANEPGPTGEATRIKLAAILEAVRRRPLAIVLTVAIALAVALAVLLLVPSRYTAWAQLIIDPRGLHIMENELNPRPQTADANIAVVESEMRVLTSTDALRELVRREGIDRDPEFVTQPWSPLAAVRALVARMLPREPARADPDSKLLETLRERISVRRAERSFAVDVWVWTRDPEKSARFANALVDIYVAQSQTARAELARRASGALDGRLEELRGRVRTSEQRVDRFKAEHDLIGTRAQLVSEQQLTELNNQLGLARAKVSEMQARLDQIERLQRGAGGSAALAQTLESPLLVELRQQQALLRGRLADLSARLGPRHPARQSAADQLRDIDTVIAQELRRIVRSARVDLEQALANERALQVKVDVLSRTAVQNSRSFVELRELEREAEASRAVYEAFLVRARELGEQTTVDTMNVRRVARATAPSRRSNLPATLILPMALGLGLFAGLALAVGLDTYGRPRARDVGIASSEAGPGLGTVPVSRGGRLVTFDGPGAEPYDRIWRRLAGAGAPAIAIASLGAADAAPEVSWNLAFAAVRAGARVVLVDASARRGLTRAFDAEGGGALTAALKLGRLPADATIKVRGTGVELLLSDAAGPASLVHYGRSALDAVLASCRAGFDVVLIEAGDERDAAAAIAAAAAGRAVLIAGPDADASRAEAAARRISAAGAVLDGVVGLA